MAKPGAPAPKTAPRKPKAAPAAKPKAKAKAATKAKAAPKSKRSAAPAVDRLRQLADQVQAVRENRHDSPRTARLLAAGVPKMAQKVVEEAAEVAIEAVLNRREPLINESVDLLYNLAALWNGAGVTLDDLWAEMDRRHSALGMAEKLPKDDI